VTGFFLPSRMVKEENKVGEFPGFREAYGELIKIAAPSVAEMVLMSLIGWADSIMVGRLGTAPFAAVGLTDQPRMILMSIFFALNVGVTAIVARRKGQNDRKSANLALRNALVVLSLLSVTMAIVGTFVNRPLLRLAGANEDTLDLAAGYFRILIMALPINALTMAICAAQRGVGNTRITFIVNLTANLVNVFFNYCLIFGRLGFPALGVQGAALATVIGFVIGLVLAIYSVSHSKKHDSFLEVHLRDNWKLNRDTLNSLFKIGGSAMLEQVAARIGFFAYAAIVASLGTVAFAAHQVCMKFLNITFTIGDGLGIAGTSLVGQMLGKGRHDLAQMYGLISQRFAMIISLTLLGFLIGFRHTLVGFFGADVASLKTALEVLENKEMLRIAADVMIVVALIQPFQTTSVVISGCLRGAGDTTYVAMIMFICVVGIRPLLSLTATHVFHLGLVFVWLSTLIDMMIRVSLMLRRFYQGKWFGIKV
jgi:putative MATE family efflux protein